MEQQDKHFHPFSKLELNNEINQIIIKESCFSGICTDQNLKVLHSFGNISNYVKNEMFNFNLNELLSEKVYILIKAAIFRSLKCFQKITLNAINLKDQVESSSHWVNIIIQPFLIQNPNRTLLLILFLESKVKGKKHSCTKDADIENLTKQYLLSLEQDLENTRENLKIAYQWIDSSNANMKSFNEELLTANEEMKCANEELQSVNEESKVINHQQNSTNIALMELNDDLNNYFRSNINGQLFVDNQLLLKRYSPSTINLINIRESDIGRPLCDVTTNIKFETIIEDIKKVIFLGEPITREAESSIGRIYQVMTMPYIRKNSNNCEGAIVSFHDITELRKLMNELDISNRNLQESVKELEAGKEKVSQSLKKEKELSNLKSRFVSIASHEFRTPLSAIQLSNILIEKHAKKYDDEHINKHIARIKVTLRDLTGILSDFLSLERLEAGKISSQYSDTNILMLAQEITEEMQMIAKQNQQIIYEHTGDCENISIDQSLLKNCIVNLISNAIKYSEENTVIKFQTNITMSRFKIVIKDDGIGIPKEDQKHLFEAFFRAKNTGTISGTGLGLSIVARYVGIMQGQIKFRSKQNQGTSFTIIIPIQD